MATADDQPVIGTLTYLRRDPRYLDEKPYRLLGIRPTVGVPETNLQFEQYQVTVSDMRQRLKPGYTLDTNAFQLFDCPCDSTISMQAEHSDIKTYCAEMAGRLRNELDAEDAFVYEFRFRSQFLGSGHAVVDSNPDNNLSVAERFPGNPARVIHTDHSQADGLQRVHRHLTPDEKEKYLSDKYRIRCINVWRPFNETSHDLPLAFCLPDTVAVTDIQGIDKVTPDVCSESYYLYYNENHRWVWPSDMTPSEVVAFTTWDSSSIAAADHGTKCAFHAAFPNPREGEHAPRESLEIRIIVVTKCA